MKGTGPLEAGLRAGTQSPGQTKAQLRAALSGLEDKAMAEVAEARAMHIISQIDGDIEQEQALKAVLSFDTCSAIAARHRCRCLLLLP